MSFITRSSNIREVRARNRQTGKFVAMKIDCDYDLILEPNKIHFSISDLSDSQKKNIRDCGKLYYECCKQVEKEMQKKYDVSITDIHPRRGSIVATIPSGENFCDALDLIYNEKKRHQIMITIGHCSHSVRMKASFGRLDRNRLNTRVVNPNGKYFVQPEDVKFTDQVVLLANNEDYMSIQDKWNNSPKFSIGQQNAERILDLKNEEWNITNPAKNKVINCWLDVLKSGPRSSHVIISNQQDRSWWGRHSQNGSQRIPAPKKQAVRPRIGSQRVPKREAERPLPFPGYRAVRQAKARGETNPMMVSQQQDVVPVPFPPFLNAGQQQIEGSPYNERLEPREEMKLFVIGLGLHPMAEKMADAYMTLPMLAKVGTVDHLIEIGISAIHAEYILMKIKEFVN